MTAADLGAILGGDAHGNELPALFRQGEHVKPLLSIAGTHFARYRRHRHRYRRQAPAAATARTGPTRLGVKLQEVAIVEVTPVEDAAVGWLSLGPVDTDASRCASIFQILEKRRVTCAREARVSGHSWPDRGSGRPRVRQLLAGRSGAKRRKPYSRTGSTHPDPVGRLGLAYPECAIAGMAASRSIARRQNVRGVVWPT